MPKHTWSVSVTTDTGTGNTDKIDLYASLIQGIGGEAVGQKGLQVEVGHVEEIDLVVTVANIRSFSIKSTQPMRLRTNSEAVPSQEFALEANKSFAWNDASIPQPSSNPLTTNITKLFFYNEGTATASVTGGFLLKNQDSVAS